MGTREHCSQEIEGRILECKQTFQERLDFALPSICNNMSQLLS